MSFKTVRCSLRHVQRACWLDLLCRFNLESRKKIHSLNAHFLYMVQGMHPFAENSHHDDHIVCFLNMIRKWTNFLHAGQMSSIIEGYRNIWLRWSSWIGHIEMHLQSCCAWCMIPIAFAAGMGKFIRGGPVANIDWTSRTASARYGKQNTNANLYSFSWLHTPGSLACMTAVSSARCKPQLLKKKKKNSVVVSWQTRRKRPLHRDKHDESNWRISWLAQCKSNMLECVFSCCNEHGHRRVLHAQYKCIAVCTCQQSIRAYIAVAAISKKNKVKFWSWTQHASVQTWNQFSLVHQAPRSK